MTAYFHLSKMCRFALAVLAIAALAAANFLPAHAQTPEASTEIGLPNRGEIQWRGAIQGRSAEDASGDATLVLLVTQTTAPNGTVAPLEPPAFTTVRVPTRTPLLSVDPDFRPVPADLDYGAVVTINGKSVVGKEKSGVARVIQLVKTASETMGRNLLPQSGDPKSWFVFFDSPRAEGDVAKDAKEPGALRVGVTTTTGTDWHAKIWQKAELTAGTTYTLRFRARADVPRLITLDSQKAGEGYHNAGLYQIVTLSAEWRVYRVTFTAAGSEGKSNAELSLLAGARAGVVSLADVALAEGDHALPSASRVPQSAGKNLLVLPNEPNCWMLKAVSPADANFSVEAHTLKVTVTKLDDHTYIWGSQLFQMTDLEPGRQYEIRFLAKADAPRPLGIWAWIDNGHYRRVGLETTVHLETDWRPYHVTFTATKPLDGHTKAPCFCFGNALGSVWLSNVVLTPL